MPWFGRQIATMRMQLNYQVKRFGKVDALLPGCLILDPLTAAMKRARQFATNAELPEIEKTYRRARARLRYDQSAYLSSVMAWMYVSWQIVLLGCCVNCEAHGSRPAKKVA